VYIEKAIVTTAMTVALNRVYVILYMLCLLNTLYARPVAKRSPVSTIVTPL
jgi:hypothetical protein